MQRGINFNNLVTISLMIESVNEGASIPLLRSLRPKSAKEQRLLEMLMKRKPVFSFVVYETIRAFSRFKRNDVMKNFFFDMDILYALHAHIEEESLSPELFSEHLEFLHALASRYARVVESIDTLLSNKSESSLPNKANALSFLKSFAASSLCKEIEQIVTEIDELARKHYSADYIEKTYTDVYALLYEESRKILELSGAQLKEPSRELILISFSPMVWISKTMDEENLFSQFLLSKAGENYTKFSTTKNMLWYFFKKNETIRKSYVSDIYVQIFLRDILASDERRTKKDLSLIFSQNEKRGIVGDFISFANEKQLKEEVRIQDAIIKAFGDTFHAGDGKTTTALELTNTIAQGVYEITNLIANDKSALLFFKEGIESDMPLAYLLAEIIENAIKHKGKK